MQIDQIDTMAQGLILALDSLDGIGQNLAGLGYELIGIDWLILQKEQSHILLADKPLT